MSMHAKTRMGHVHYTVADLDRQIAFYRDILGFRVHANDGAHAELGTGAEVLLRLSSMPGARRVRRTAGLYHTAFLVPTRWELAHLLQRILTTGAPIHGTSNHGTHLAIYLPDPEGNGIELAWDFPRDAWPMKDGMFDLSRAPGEGINVGQLLAELERDPSPWHGVSPGTCVGHVHLHVADLTSAERFYHQILGFDVTLKSCEMGAYFFSAGGYHHHIGTNVWLGTGVGPAPKDALGLKYLTILVPDHASLDDVRSRLAQAGVPATSEPGGLFVTDPSGIGLLISVGNSL